MNITIPRHKFGFATWFFDVYVLKAWHLSHAFNVVAKFYGMRYNDKGLYFGKVFDK